jgi:hypothetical protein
MCRLQRLSHAIRILAAAIASGIDVSDGCSRRIRLALHTNRLRRTKISLELACPDTRRIARAIALFGTSQSAVKIDSWIIVLLELDGRVRRGLHAALPAAATFRGPAAHGLAPIDRCWRPC